MQLVSRAQWNARPPKRTINYEPSRPCTGHWNGPTITIGGKPTWGHEYCASIVRSIQNFHMDDRGWYDIAYNFVVCPHGYVFEGRGLWHQNGANGTNHGNQTSPAIMWLAGGNNPFTEESKLSFVQCTQYVAQNTTAKQGAIGHRDWKSTTCPGDKRYKWIKLGMPVTYNDLEGNVFFHSHEERVTFVNNSYQRIVGRPPESDKVRNWWVYTIALQPSAALELVTLLLKERRLATSKSSQPYPPK